MRRFLQNTSILFLMLMAFTYSYSQQKGEVTDADGNSYPIVEIGTQKWMGKNLKTTKYNDGAAIDYPAADNTNWENNSTGAYAWFDNDEANKPSYGGLYNWHAVETGKVCPTGWRVPTDEDWIELMDELGGSSTAGGKLKITGTDFWFSPNTGATNESNFSAVGGGLRSNDGAFVFLKDFGFYWSSLPPSSSKVKTYNCSSNNGKLNSENYSLNHGVSIRCIKDATVSEPTVTTTAITNIAQTTATSGGNVTNDGGAEVTARGVCWSTAENPTITNSKTVNGTGVGEFTSSITGLTANTKYYVRAYATNSAGTGYGEQVSFTTSTSVPFVEPNWVYYNEENIGIQSNGAQQDSNGNIWFAGGGGFTKYTTEGQVTFYNHPTLGNIGISTFVLENDNAMWVGNVTQGVFKFDGDGNWVQYNKDNSELESNYVHSIAVDSKGNKWITSNGGGLAMFDDTEWTVYTKENSDLPNNTIYSIFIDKNDNVWLGWEYGLVKFDGITWSLYNNGNAPGVVGTISAISIDDKNNIWIGNDHNIGVATASLADLTSWTVYNYGNSDYPDSRSNSISFDKDGRVWFGTDKDELVIFDGSSWYIYKKSNSNWPTTHKIKSIFSDSKGNTWLSCEYGVVLVGQYVSTVLTTNASEITQTSAIAGGEVKFNGGADVTVKGVVWSKSENPTIADSKTENGAGNTEFTSNLTGLTANTKYYVRAYATNSAGTGYGEQVSFTTLEEYTGETVTDIDGNVYPVVEIGTQKWMGKNLKTTKYNDETAIAYPATDNTDWENNSTGAYAWYKNDEANKPSYGGLYNWHAVETGKVCPTGWHVPTNEDWIQLMDELGGSSTAGGKLKITGTDFWFTPNTGATNESNFSAVGGGLRSNDGAFVFLKDFGFYWSSLLPSSNKVKTYNCSSNNGELNSENYSLNHGVSIRCIKDATVSEPTVTTTTVTNITQTTATSGGNITSDGGAEVTVRGVCWSTSENPTIANSKIENGTGTGEFTSELTGLAANTKYYVRAYATNSEGTGYGEQYEFTTTATGNLISSTTSLNVYPNPFTSELRIEYEKGIKQISITNVSGQIVISKFYNGETSLLINTEMLGSGLYLIKAIDIEGNLLHIKVVKP